MSDNAPPTEAQIEAQLALFAKDPVAAMERQPPKAVVQGPAVGPAPLAPYAAGAGFVPRRDQTRSKTTGRRDDQLVRLDQILPGRAPFLRNDRAEDLVDGTPTQLVRKLELMEQRSLQRARLTTIPWSSHYWPIYQGQLGVRYADRAAPAGQDWKANLAYVEQHPAAAIVAAGNKSAIDNLSPAEKYDLLIGDPDFSLTAKNWDAGRSYFDDKGVVETWMGVCHGWAPAAYMLPRPTRSITLPTPDNATQITFYPADIKALGCLLWAVTNPVVRFIGGRCNDKSPAKDPKSGRVTSQQCFDTNPGTWHLAIINQIGVARRSLVIDATFDYEVWNQPVVGYSYTYFNPRTRAAAAALKDARVDRAGFAEDPFASFRSPQAKTLVGVAMTLTYVAETAPTHDAQDSDARDRLVQVSYLYDLELDEGGAILGGEWYDNKHPDFLWTPPPDGAAFSVQDGNMEGAWEGGPVPSGWSDAAIAAASAGQPLAAIVNTLFRLAK